MNERIKQLRQALGLSGEKFGEKIGLKRSSISQLETGTNRITEQVIQSICLAYNVNENWLRTGDGDMFNDTADSYIAKLTKQYSLDELDQKILTAYLDLSQEERQAIKKYIDSI